jgi:hypothetical protein
MGIGEGLVVDEEEKQRKYNWVVSGGSGTTCDVMVQDRVKGC